MLISAAYRAHFPHIAVQSDSASHFRAFVQASNPLQSVMTSGLQVSQHPLCYRTPDIQIILCCALQMKLRQDIGQCFKVNMTGQTGRTGHRTDRTRRGGGQIGQLLHIEIY